MKKIKEKYSWDQNHHMGKNLAFAKVIKLKKSVVGQSMWQNVYSNYTTMNYIFISQII